MASRSSNQRCCLYSASNSALSLACAKGAKSNKVSSIFMPLLLRGLRLLLPLNKMQHIQSNTFEHMKKVPRNYVIRNSRQMSALAASTRQEIVDVLPRMGAVSV